MDCAQRLARAGSPGMTLLPGCLRFAGMTLAGCTRETLREKFRINRRKAAPSSCAPGGNHGITEVPDYGSAGLRNAGLRNAGLRNAGSW
jgi:hypothetical protein